MENAQSVGEENAIRDGVALCILIEFNALQPFERAELAELVESNPIRAFSLLSGLAKIAIRDAIDAVRTTNDALRRMRKE